MPTTWENFERPGAPIGGWMYEEADFTYDQILDLETGDSVYYEALGVAQVWTNTTPKPTTTYIKPTKTASSWNNQAKI